MIVSKQKPIAEILGIVAPFTKIFILGCGTCSTTCKSGGETEVAAMKAELEKNGKTLSGSVVVESPCIASQLKISFAKNRKAIEQAQAILVMACGSGTQSVFVNNRFPIRVLPGCDTLFAAAVDESNNFREYCSHCGECILDLTGGICPVTRCAKGILNGPCGGMNKGKCEVDKDQDCAWVLIWKEAARNNSTDELKKILLAKDHSKSVKPNKLLIQQT